MPPKQFAALMGFAFVAAWIGFGFGSAVLCVLGAGVFFAAASIAQGEIDLGRLQSRLQGHQPPPYAPPPTAPPASRVR